MRPHSGPFLSFLAYYIYMGAPSDQFLCIEYGGPLRSVNSLIMTASLCVFFHTIWGPSDHFCAYYIGAPRSFFSLTTWGPSDQFFSYNMGAPLRLVPLFTIWAPPLRSVFLHAIGGGGGTSDFSFSTKYMGAPSDQFLRLLYGAPSG